MTSTDTAKQQQHEACMKAEPQKEHDWLQKMVGDWTFEHECSMGPDQPPMKSSGSESVRTLGGLWIIGEGEGKSPDGEAMEMIVTLGYDPRTKRFVGTWIASVMCHMWVYDGELDAAGKVLTLNAVGPSFADPTKEAKYQDIFEVVSDDHRILRSQFLGDDGEWHQFMTGHYRRAK